ncbi:MAG: hypothetical protein ACQESN_09280 [Thermotogota bacterium]
MRKSILFLFILISGLIIANVTEKSEIITTGPNFNVETSGYLEVGLKFDEDGFSLYEENQTLHSAWFDYEFSIIAVSESNNSTLTVNFIPGDWGVKNQPIDFKSVVYNSEYYTAEYNNTEYSENFSDYFLGNWYDVFGNAVNPIGEKYLKTNSDFFVNSEMVYIPFEEEYTRHATSIFLEEDTENDEINISGDIFALKIGVPLDLFNFQIKSGLWNTSTNIEELEEDNTEYLGYAVEGEFSGQKDDLLEGIFISGMYGSQPKLEEINYVYEEIVKNAYNIHSRYKRNFKIFENDFINIDIIPKANGTYRKNIKFIPFASELVTKDASSISGGIDFELDFDKFGTIEIKDEVEYLFGDYRNEDTNEEEKIYTQYGIRYYNEKLHELIKYDFEIMKKYSQYLNVPIGVLMNIYGDYTHEYFNVNYSLLAGEQGLKGDNHILIEDLSKIIENDNLGYKLSAEVYPLKGITLSGNIYNYILNQNSEYEIKNIEDMAYNAELVYTPDQIIKFGAHIGNDQNFEELTDLNWYLFAKAQFNF